MPSPDLLRGHSKPVEFRSNVIREKATRCASIAANSPDVIVINEAQTEQDIHQGLNPKYPTYDPNKGKTRV